jgi:hypothetical protein
MSMGPTPAGGGHGKRQFGVQAQYLIGLYPSVELVICAGATGGIAPELSIDDVVIGTETVEHHYRAVRDAPSPRFPRHGPSVEGLRSKLIAIVVIRPPCRSICGQNLDGSRSAVAAPKISASRIDKSRYKC